MNGRLDAEQMAAKAEAAWHQMEAIRRQHWQQSVGQRETPGDLVARLRRWTHAADAAPASDLMDEAADEIARLRLTAAEREAVEWYAAFGAGDHAATLRGLLLKRTNDGKR
jgi:hypothetical protein